MSDKTSSRSSSANPESRYWFARHSKSIIFLILTLAVVGVYEALSLPIAVFPATNFPRIIIGVDNGVMPIDQMEVTITRQLENAVNSVPGLEDVRSTTSRGSAEVDLSFNWNVDMVQTLQLVNSEMARIQSTLPSTAQIETHRLDFASFPDSGLQPHVRQSPADPVVGNCHLRHQAAFEPARMAWQPSWFKGGQEPEFQVTPDPSKMLRAKVTVQDILDAANNTNIVDSPGLLSRNHQLFLGLLDAQVHNPDDIGNMVIKNVNDAPVRVRDIGTVTASSAPNYTVVTANGKPAVLVSVNRQPDSNTVEVANLAHAGNRSHPRQTSRRRRVERLLRPVQHRARVDRQRARRHHHRTPARRVHHLAVPAGLGHGADDRPGDSGGDFRHVHRHEDAGSELQHDDSRRPRGGRRIGHRRRDRGR